MRGWDWGDIRDWLIGRLRTMPRTWSLLSEDDQRAHFEAADRAAMGLMRAVLARVTDFPFQQVPVRVGKFSVKEGNIRCEVQAMGTDDNILAFLHGDRAMLVLASEEEFRGEREPAAIDPDEPGLPLNAAE